MKFQKHYLCSYYYNINRLDILNEVTILMFIKVKKIPCKDIMRKYSTTHFFWDYGSIENQCISFQISSSVKGIVDRKTKITFCPRLNLR